MYQKVTPVNFSLDPKELIEGSIILIKLPQADGNYKQRPALMLNQMPGYGDFLVCGISAQLHQEIKGFDEALMPDATNRLKRPSVIRLGFLAVVPTAQIVSIIGYISPELHATLLKRLADYLIKSSLFKNYSPYLTSH